MVEGRFFVSGARAYGPAKRRRKSGKRSPKKSVKSVTPERILVLSQELIGLLDKEKEPAHVLKIMKTG
jgi:hypothetical protein